MNTSYNCSEKLYEELVKARENLGTELDSSALAEIPYLNAVIKETLRKYPPMGWLDRITSKPYRLDENFTMPANMPLYVNAVGMQMDPEYFPNPKLYDPERFMPENENNIKPYTFIPFGEGPRMCIGMRFAYLTMRSAIASVVRNFEIRAPAGCILPEDWPAEHRGLFFMPDGKVQLLFIPRN